MASTKELTLQTARDLQSAVNKFIGTPSREQAHLIHSLMAGYRETYRESETRRLAEQISSVCQGHGVMKKECVTPLLQEYLEIMENPDPMVREHYLNHFAGDFLPSLMATLAELNEWRENCPACGRSVNTRPEQVLGFSPKEAPADEEDDPSTWVTDSEMESRKYIYPFSDPPYPHDEDLQKNLETIEKYPYRR